MQTTVYNQNAEKISEQELNPDVFEVKINESLVHQAVVAQMSNERQVLAHTKDRSEVHGGGRKPWKQKGTGRARAGTSRSPIWIGGGITFGPRKDKNFSKKINIKMKKQALIMVLSDKAKHNALILLDKIEFPEAKTKKANEIFSNLEKKVLQTDDKEKTKRSFLVLINKKDDNTNRAISNLKDVEVARLENINVVDLLKYKNLVLTVDGVKQLEKIYSKKQ